MLHRPHGCATCKATGFVGRIGVYECVRVDDRLRRLIAEGAGDDALAAQAFSSTDTLADSARALVLAGTTTVEEAIRVTRQDGGGVGGV
jgi:general secretion pathway protein E